MKNTRTLSQPSRAAVLAVALTFISQAAHADAPKTWAELKAYIQGKHVSIRTKQGGQFIGRVVDVRTDTIVLDGDGRHEVARESLLSLNFERYPLNIFRFGSAVKTGYTNAYQDLFSSRAILGLAEVPCITVYTVVTAPFSLLGDVFHNHRREAGEAIPIPRN